MTIAKTSVQLLPPERERREGEGRREIREESERRQGEREGRERRERRWVDRYMDRCGMSWVKRTGSPIII